MREKLIEILQGAPFGGRVLDYWWYREQIAKMADYLIANGVTFADVPETNVGKWIAVPSSDMATGKAYTCSECGKMRFGSFKPNYCPNCGAKMSKPPKEGE